MALKDYNDPNAYHSLCFVAGQLVRVLNQDTEKGLIFGEIGNKRGFCPKNILTEVVQSSIMNDDSDYAK